MFENEANLMSVWTQLKRTVICIKTYIEVLFGAHDYKYRSPLSPLPWNDDHIKIQKYTTTYMQKVLSK